MSWSSKKFRVLFVLFENILFPNPQNIPAAKKPNQPIQGPFPRISKYQKSYFALSDTKDYGKNGSERRKYEIFRILN